MHVLGAVFPLYHLPSALWNWIIFHMSRLGILPILFLLSWFNCEIYYLIRLLIFKYVFKFSRFILILIFSYILRCLFLLLWILILLLFNPILLLLALLILLGFFLKLIPPIRTYIIAILLWICTIIHWFSLFTIFIKLGDSGHWFDFLS